MQKMKDSGIEWIGQIPVKWKLAKFKRFAQSGMGCTILKTEVAEKGIPIYSATQGSELFGYISRCKLILKQGDLVIPARGNSIGCVTYVLDDVATCTQTTIYSKISNINKKYLFYCCYGFKEIWFDYEDTAIPQITVGQIQNNIVVVPPISNQTCIVDFLDEKCGKIDRYIEKQQQIIEKLKAYKQSVITEAVTKGLDPNVPMKDSGLKYNFTIPLHWENRKMISILEMRVVDGAHESPELFDNGIPYISATAIINGKIDFSKMRGFISEEYCDICDQRYAPQLNDILMIKLGASTGQVAMVETTERFNIWVPLAAIRCNQSANPRFVYYAFQADYFIKQMELSWTYGTQQTLGVKTIERLRILLPPIKEQTIIAEYLKNRCQVIDNAIEKNQIIVNKLAEYKKSLIYEAVTGKLEV